MLEAEESVCFVTHLATLSVTLIPFTHAIYTLIIHKIVRRLFKKKKKILERGFYNTHFVRESYSSLREKSLCGVWYRGI